MELSATRVLTVLPQPRSTKPTVNFVTDCKVITRNFPEGLGTLEMLCIYEVVDGRMRRASLAIGEKTLCASATGNTPAFALQLQR
jgi:hypothetical protein